MLLILGLRAQHNNLAVLRKQVCDAAEETPLYYLPRQCAVFPDASIMFLQNQYCGSQTLFAMKRFTSCAMIIQDKCSQTLGGCLALLGNTHSATAATGGLGVLTLHAQAPVMPQTTVVPACAYSFLSRDFQRPQ